MNGRSILSAAPKTSIPVPSLDIVLKIFDLYPRNRTEILRAHELKSLFIIHTTFANEDERCEANDFLRQQCVPRSEEYGPIVAYVASNVSSTLEHVIIPHNMYAYGYLKAIHDTCGCTRVTQRVAEEHPSLFSDMQVVP